MDTLSVDERKTIIADSKTIFFKGAIFGCNDNYQLDKINKRKLDGFGNTTIEYSEGSYRVVNYFSATPHSDRWAGTITIYFNADPVWWMSYCGSYPDNSTGLHSMLQELLSMTYKAGIFIGGRGPGEWSGGKFIYQNMAQHNRFDGYFQGYEQVHSISRTDGPVGFLHYMGKPLI